MGKQEEWPGVFDLPEAVDAKEVKAIAPRPRVEPHKVQVIEATSKEWKWVQLSGCLIAVCCFVLFFPIVGMMAAWGWPELVVKAIGWLFLLGSVGGTVRFIYGRFGAWWHHG